MVNLQRKCEKQMANLLGEEEEEEGVLSTSEPHQQCHKAKSFVDWCKSLSVDPPSKKAHVHCKIPANVTEICTISFLRKSVMY